MRTRGRTHPSHSEHHTMTDHVLQVSGLQFAYPGGDSPLFADWSASFPPGVSFVAGGDGRGKTTLLRLLAGDLPAQGGRLSVRDTDLGTQAARYRQQVFWADARAPAWDAMSPHQVRQTLAKAYPQMSADRFDALMAPLYLSEHLHKQMFMMSTGTRRKVLLAAGFASGATVLLLDSPFAALDKPSISA